MCASAVPRHSRPHSAASDRPSVISEMPRYTFHRCAPSTTPRHIGGVGRRLTSPAMCFFNPQHHATAIREQAFLWLRHSGARLPARSSSPASDTHRVPQWCTVALLSLFSDRCASCAFPQLAVQEPFPRRGTGVADRLRMGVQCTLSPGKRAGECAPCAVPACHSARRPWLVEWFQSPTCVRVHPRAQYDPPQSHCLMMDRTMCSGANMALLQTGHLASATSRHSTGREDRAVVMRGFKRAPMCDGKPS